MHVFLRLVFRILYLISLYTPLPLISLCPRFIRKRPDKRIEDSCTLALDPALLLALPSLCAPHSMPHPHPHPYLNSDRNPILIATTLSTMQPQFLPRMRLHRVRLHKCSGSKHKSRSRDIPYHGSHNIHYLSLNLIMHHANVQA